MNDVLHEQISAFMDGELPPEECELLLRRLASNPELADRWLKYHLIGDALRGELAPGAARDLAPRVGHALRTQPVARRHLRRAATAVAGVAVLGLAGVVGALVSNRVDNGKVLTSSAGPVSGVSQPSQVSWREAPTPVKAELNRYLLMHDIYGPGPISAGADAGQEMTASRAAVVTTAGTGQNHQQ